MEKRILWVDGACSQNGDWSGGYGVVELEISHLQTMTDYIPAYSLNFYTAGYSENTTNNREEIKGMIEALKIINDSDKSNFIIYSDSAYVVNMCNNWIWNWINNDWKNSKNITVENVDLVKQLYKYLNKNFSKCQIRKVKGHNGILGNELADALASNNIKNFQKLLRDNKVAYDKECYCINCNKDLKITFYGDKGKCPICGKGIPLENDYLIKNTHK